MSKTDEIEQALTRALTPHQLQVIDDSEKHRGHAGYQEGGESHYHVVIRSAAFEGLSRIARHRKVHEALGPDLIGRIHALSMDLDT